MSVPSSPTAASAATSPALGFETPTRRPTSFVGRHVVLAAVPPHLPPAVFAAARSSATTGGATAPGASECPSDPARLPPALYRRRLDFAPLTEARDIGIAGHKRVRSEVFGGEVGAPTIDASREATAALPFNQFGSYERAASPTGLADDKVPVRAGTQIRRKVDSEAAGSETSSAGDGFSDDEAATALSASSSDNLASPSPTGLEDLADLGASRSRHRRDLPLGRGVQLGVLPNLGVGRRLDLESLAAAAAPHPRVGGGSSPPRILRAALPVLTRVGALEADSYSAPANPMLSLSLRVAIPAPTNAAGGARIAPSHSVLERIGLPRPAGNAAGGTAVPPTSS